MQAASSRSPDRWRQIEKVFEEALKQDPQRRQAFLEVACGTDFELHREVSALLASLDQSGRFLESAVEDAAKSYLGDQSAPSLREGSLLDHYRVTQLIGAGGMSQVYLAEDIRLKRKVALKVLAQPLTRNPAFLRRFEQEAQVLSALNHANLLTVFDVCHSDGRYVLVTEFVEGETLRQLLSRGRLPRSQALDIASQVAAALGAAHASGVIHRDIKPENVLVRPNGCVKVLDFGIAKLIEPGNAFGMPRVTPVPGATSVVGTVLGSPRYMSPEQARGLAVDARSDLFSLGALLYEMLTGRPAFQGETQNDLIADILRTNPPPVDSPPASGGLQPIVTRALEKDRELRYQSAEEFLADLQRFQREDDYSRRSTGRVAPWRRISVWMFAALIVLLAVLSVVAVRERAGRAAETPPRSLAVLPFRNLRPSPDTDFLGFSLADEVIAKLGYVKALVVRPSSEINRYREGYEASSDLSKVAADLNAGMLLTGTYLKEGEDLRITARLIGFQPRTVLWQNTIDVKYGNLLTVQNLVAQSIIQGLELRLNPEEQARLKPDAAVNNLGYEYYLRGVDLYAISNFPAAIAMLERSASINPNYGPTWAHLGRAYTTNASLQFGGREGYRKAEAAYDKAMALNPVFPEPRVYMANLLTDTGRVEEAVPLLRVALQSSPNNAEAHWELGYAFRYGGMLKESAAECELARRLDPEVKINSSALNTYLYLGEYDKFLNSLPSNDSPLLVFYHGLGLYYKRGYAEAAGDFDRAFELAPELLQAQIGKALGDGLRHDASRGIARVKETERKMESRGVTDPEAMYKIAQAYAVLGDSGDALQTLQRSTSGGFFCYSYMSQDPLLRSLSGSQEFGRILEQARKRQQQFERRFGQNAGTNGNAPRQ